MIEVERVTHRLEHMLEAINGVQDTIAGLSQETVLGHWTLRSAVERGIEIVSEATRHLPAPLTDAYPEIPWRNIRGIGNFIRHEYDTLEPDLLWKIAAESLPPLKAAVLAMLAQLRSDPRAASAT